MATPSNFRPRRPDSSQPASSTTSQTIGQYQRMEHIGKGSFAEVYRGMHVEKRQAVAIKSVNMNKLNKKLKDNLVSEITILQSLHHPHIVSLIDCQETPNRMHLIMEFCELGDLSAFIKKREDLKNHPITQRMIEKYPNPKVGGLNEVITRHFAKQIASALEFLRSKNYIHRDIKPQNLLLNPSSMYYSQSGTLERMPLAADAHSLIPATGIESLPMLKIADFGFARLLPQTSLAETLCGSPLYMAPEILRYEKYGPTADLWSVGTVLFEMMCGKPPFRANNHVELLRKIEERQDSIRFPDGLVCSRPMKNLIRALLKRKPMERMPYDAFFVDPVIREDIPGLVDEDLPQSLEPEPVVQSKRAGKMPVEDRQSPYSESPREKASFGTTPPSRPSSRAKSGQPYGTTPPRPSSVRRMSNTPLPTIEQRVPSREQRPPLTNANTAPARTGTLQSRDTATTSGRRYSRHETSSPVPAQHDVVDARPAVRRAASGAMRDAAERAAQDHADEEGYVVIEKRRVEFDALADEIAASPQAARDRRLSARDPMIQRRATTQGAPITNTDAAAPSRAIQIQSKQGAMQHQRANSYERRRSIRPSYESATSALTKAMNLMYTRGLGLSPPMMKGVSPPQGYAAFPTYPTARSSLLLVGDSGKTVTKDEDSLTIKRVEELAQLGHVVYGFADVKYKQLVPVAPSEQELGIGPDGVPRKLGQEEDLDEDDDDDLTLDAILTLSEESLVLYVKSLALLNKAMDIAGTWWNRRHLSSPTSEPPGRGTQQHVERLNQVVAWVRDRFNECCVKSEIAARKLKQAQQQLPADHPSSPANRPSDSGSVKAHGSADTFYLATGVTAEKLLYDRALEMSRSAAVNELVGTDFPGCEMNYWTAILMVQAILEDDEESSSRKSSTEDINGLEDEDRKTIQKLLESMRARHRALQKKMDAQKAAAKRPSITSAPGRSPSSQGAAR